MKIECPKCKFSGNIADQLVPAEGRTVGCPKCKERFFIKKPGNAKVSDTEEFEIERTSFERSTEQKPQQTHDTEDQKPEEKRSAEMIYCRGCGEQIHLSARSCPHCGAFYKAVSGKSKATAGLLALFLGGIGIHRFYLGQWWGLLYLIFCWTFIPAIIAFVEAIVFFTMPDDVWLRKYG